MKLNQLPKPISKFNAKQILKIEVCIFYRDVHNLPIMNYKKIFILFCESNMFPHTTNVECVVCIDQT